MKLHRLAVLLLLLLPLLPGVTSGASAQTLPAPAAIPSTPSPAPTPKTPVPTESPLRSEIASADRIQAAQLAAAMEKPGAPLVLQVGPRTLYDQAHILGAEYVGAGGTEQGLAALRTRVAHLEKDRWIVLYCGCCPWDKCPNIRPALHHLRELGFTHVQALYLPQNFGADWVGKGLPTEQ